MAKIKLLNDLSWLESRARSWEMKCSRGPLEALHFHARNLLLARRRGCLAWPSAIAESRETTTRSPISLVSNVQIKGPPTLIPGACGEVKLKLQITCNGTFYEMSWRWFNETFYESLWRWSCGRGMASLDGGGDCYGLCLPGQYSLYACHMLESIDYGPEATWHLIEASLKLSYFPAVSPWCWENESAAVISHSLWIMDELIYVEWWGQDLGILWY